MTCFAAGSGMRFLDVMDLCSIFGNALDNAIEYEKKIGDPEKRLIKVTVYNQNRFLLIRIENYCEETIPLRDGLPVTTKKDPIRHAAEKYGGSLTVTQEPPWFVLTVLIPAEGIPAE